MAQSPKDRVYMRVYRIGEVTMVEVYSPNGRLEMRNSYRVPSDVSPPPMDTCVSRKKACEIINALQACKEKFLAEEMACRALRRAQLGCSRPPSPCGACGNRSSACEPLDLCQMTCPPRSSCSSPAGQFPTTPCKSGSRSRRASPRPCRSKKSCKAVCSKSRQKVSVSAKASAKGIAAERHADAVDEGGSGGGMKKYLLIGLLTLLLLGGGYAGYKAMKKK